ncbi:MAG: hypothetical protein BWX55_00525 [Deltaproteobacteria bacterium ADurb.Bin022]|nr:MAG: hypothetical protein BWX55_00525 [Deltaproteobacteria bacterium ADurb.Bin022]
MTGGDTFGCFDQRTSLIGDKNEPASRFAAEFFQTQVIKIFEERCYLQG